MIGDWELGLVIGDRDGDWGFGSRWDQGLGLRIGDRDWEL